MPVLGQRCWSRFPTTGNVPVSPLVLGEDTNPESGYVYHRGSIERFYGLNGGVSLGVKVTGITYGAEWSASMLPGSWIEVSDSGSGETHVFSVPAGADGKLFMRLKVTGR